MSATPITSPGNPRIKQARALTRRKERDATGLCLAEGIFHVGEALAAAEAGRAVVEHVLYAPDLLVSDFGRGLVAVSYTHLTLPTSDLV